MKAAVWAIGVVFVVPGCAVGPDLHAPSAPGVDRYLRDGEATQATSASGVAQRFTAITVSADWWHILDSPTFDLAMEAATTANPDLQQAQVNLRIMQDLLRIGASVFYLQVIGSVDVSCQTAVLARLGQIEVPSLFTLWTLGASISYAVDLSDGNRHAVEALAAQTGGQKHVVAATHLAPVGNLVSATVAHATYRTQVDATRSLIAVVREQMEIAHVQVKASVVVHASEPSLAAQLASLEASPPPLEQRRDQAAHLQVVSADRFPPEVDIVDVALNGL